MKTIKNLKAEEIRKSILQLAIQGKLVKQDPNDEPASELVKRIYAEKQRLIKEGKIKKDKNESFIFKGDDNCYYEKIGNNAPVKLEDLPFDIPDNWTWIRLKNISDLNGGYAFKSEKFCNDGIRVIRISDFDENGLKHKNIKRYPYSPDLDSYRIIPQDILLCMTGGTVGKSAYIKAIDEDCYINQRVALIRIKNVNTDYFYSVLTSSYISNVINASKTSTNDNISMKLIEDFLIPLPPIEEELRIVDKINSFEPLIAQYSAAENRLSILEEEFPEKLKKSVLQYAIEGKLVKQDPNDEPASVLLKRIKAEKERLIKEGKIKRDKNESYIYQGDDKNYYEKSFLKLRLGSIISVSSGSSINIRNLDYSKKYPVFGGNGIVGTYDDYLVEPNTIILGRVGANCGSVHISRQKAFVSDNALIVYPKTNFIDIDYLVWALRSINYKNMISSTAQPLISGKLLYPIEILIPSLKTQKRIVLKINRLYEVFV